MRWTSRTAFKSFSLCRFSGIRTVRGAPCFTANTLPVSSHFFTQVNMVFLDGTRPCRPTLNCRLKIRFIRHRLCFIITTNTCNTLYVPTLHCDWPYEMSSPLPFPFPSTTTSYRAGVMFKFELCQSAPRHPVCLRQGSLRSRCMPKYSTSSGWTRYVLFSWTDGMEIVWGWR